MLARLKPLFTSHWLVTLILMGLFGLAFGLVSLNIFMLLNENFALIARAGTMALVDGALLQLVELVIYGYAAVIFYLLLKICERSLVEAVLG